MEPGQILVQLKATDELDVLKDGMTISFPMDRRDLKVWLRELSPVIFVVYDAPRKRAWWLHVQNYFQAISTRGLFSKTGSIRVHIPMSNQLDRRAIQRFAAYRSERLLLLPWEA